jgi:hypothetical protein
MESVYQRRLENSDRLQYQLCYDGWLVCLSFLDTDYILLFIGFQSKPQLQFALYEAKLNEEKFLRSSVIYL